jgi:hypothetical protein
LARRRFERRAEESVLRSGPTLILVESEMLQNSTNSMLGSLCVRCAPSTISLLFVPVCDRTEINMEALARGMNHGAIRHRHRTFHGTGEISDWTYPFTLPQHDLLRIVDEVLVGKHLEKRDFLMLVRIKVERWRLIRPLHDAVFGVIMAERRKVLCVPGIIQLLHTRQVFASVHNVTSNQILQAVSRSNNRHEPQTGICLCESQPNTHGASP